jgi:hypothetical protein
LYNNTTTATMDEVNGEAQGDTPTNPTNQPAQAPAPAPAIPGPPQQRLTKNYDARSTLNESEPWAQRKTCLGGDKEFDSLLDSLTLFFTSNTLTFVSHEVCFDQAVAVTVSEVVQTTCARKTLL